MRKSRRGTILGQKAVLRSVKDVKVKIARWHTGVKAGWAAHVQPGLVGGGVDTGPLLDVDHDSSAALA